jgi:hypothetical protein
MLQGWQLLAALRDDIGHQATAAHDDGLHAVRLAKDGDVNAAARAAVKLQRRPVAERGKEARHKVFVSEEGRQRWRGCAPDATRRRRDSSDRDRRRQGHACADEMQVGAR